jgi:cell division protein FtsB
MAEYQKSRKLQKLMNSKLTLAVLLALFLFLSVNLWKIASKERETNQARAAAESQLANLRSQNDSLQSDIDKLQTSGGVEESIRDKFRVVKDGEGLVVIVDDQNGNNATSTRKLSIFRQFLKDLFGN